MTRPRHWHVDENISGYLPDSDIETHDTRASAVSSMRWHKESWLDYFADTPEGQPIGRVRGNARTGYAVDRAPDDGFMLPIYINIWPCTDHTCEPEEDN